MTGRRGWYVVGLVAAVLALLLSVGAAALVVTHRAAWSGAQVASAEGWRQGLAGNGMMGRGNGMMGGWDDEAARITAEQATATAHVWVDAHEAGATLGQPAAMPWGYVFTVTRDGQVVGTIMVNDDSGQLVWRGAAVPSPTTTES